MQWAFDYAISKGSLDYTFTEVDVRTYAELSDFTRLMSISMPV